MSSIFCVLEDLFEILPSQPHLPPKLTESKKSSPTNQNLSPSSKPKGAQPAFFLPANGVLTRGVLRMLVSQAEA
jgi:hypothetical protein